MATSPKASLPGELEEEYLVQISKMVESHLFELAQHQNIMNLYERKLNSLLQWMDTEQNECADSHWILKKSYQKGLAIQTEIFDAKIRMNATIKAYYYNLDAAGPLDQLMQVANEIQNK